MRSWIVIALVCSSVCFAEEPLQKLIDGNKRYVKDETTHPNRGQERRTALKSGQAPFAVIVSCADSRVAPEILFDQGVGDLFVVRVAGNVIGPIELDSIEYAVLYLGSPLVVVMGHKNCGAVDAVIEGETSDIESIAQLINPAVQRAKAGGDRDLLERATKLNAKDMVEFLRNSAAIKKKNPTIVPAYYNIQTGEVEWLSETEPTETKKSVE